MELLEDGVPELRRGLIEKKLDGFGELFLDVALEEVNSLGVSRERHQMKGESALTSIKLTIFLVSSDRHWSAMRETSSLTRASSSSYCQSVSLRRTSVKIDLDQLAFDSKSMRDAPSAASVNVFSALALPVSTRAPKS